MEPTLCFSDFGSKSSSESCIDDTASGSYDRAKAFVSLKVFWYVEDPSVVSSRAHTGVGICIDPTQRNTWEWTRVNEEVSNHSGRWWVKDTGGLARTQATEALQIEWRSKRARSGNKLRHPSRLQQRKKRLLQSSRESQWHHLQSRVKKSDISLNYPNIGF